MAIPPLLPIGSTPSIGGSQPAATPGKTGSGFGGMLTNALDNLNNLQNQSTNVSAQAATGQATNISSVVMEVERASLSLQLATQVRNKAVDAYNELMRMQV
jgi:flagellar hook-basal body complex protein FliE